MDPVSIASVAAPILGGLFGKKSKAQPVQQQESGFASLKNKVLKDFADQQVAQDILGVYNRGYMPLQPGQRYNESDPIFRSQSRMNWQGYYDNLNRQRAAQGQGQGDGGAAAAAAAAAAANQSSARQYILEQLALANAKNDVRGGRQYRDILENQNFDWSRLGQVVGKYNFGNYPRGTSTGDPYLNMYGLGSGLYNKPYVDQQIQKFNPYMR